MIAYYFGDSASPLYGVYYPPVSQQSRDCGIVLCNSIDQEYMRSHRSLHNLATKLAKAGYHTFHFDYFGTGDSSGIAEEGETTRWIQDIKSAITELRDTSGLKKISLCGVRIGASLAMHATKNETDIEHLFMWDPVVDGKSFIEKLHSGHQIMLNDPDRFSVSRSNYQDAHNYEFLGYPYSKQKQNSIEAINLLKTDTYNTKKIFLITTEENDLYQNLNKQLESSDIKTEHTYIPDSIGWDNYEKLEIAIKPFEIIQTIISKLS